MLVPLWDHYGPVGDDVRSVGVGVAVAEMALFLARASMAAGIVLDSPAESQGFTDIGAVSEEAQNVINGFSQEGDHARASLVVVVKLFLIGLGDTGALTRVVFLSGGGRIVAGGRLLRPGSSRSPDSPAPGAGIAD